CAAPFVPPRSCDPRDLHSFPTRRSSDLRPSGREGAERVRVIEVGLADGSVNELLDATAQEVEDYFATHGRDEILKIAHDEELARSEEHTSELQSRENLVCRLLLEKKKGG